jgi:hypothetical protein
MGRPLGPSGGRDPGGGGTGRPEGLSGGRAACWRSGAVSGGVAAAAGAVGAAAAGAAGDWGGFGAAAGAAGAAGTAVDGVGRLLLIRRDERAAGTSVAAGAVGAADAAGATGASAVPDLAAAGADTGRAGAFLTGPLLGAELLDTEVSGRRAGASPVLPPSVPGVGEADFAALTALAAFLAGAGSSGWTGRRKPSASALRRTRSACASSMEDEWLLTPMPRERASSSPSLLVRPSSLASS